MATGSPVSFWYGTRAQFDSITTKLDTTLYFITDEQALYKGTVKFSGSGVDTLLTISSTTPSASIVTTGDKYFDTSDNLIHVLLNDNGTVSTTATYEPANGALYYNADAQRFQTLVKDGSSYIPTEIYDAGISVEDGTGLVLNGTTVAGLDATTNSKGVVQVGTNLNVSNGVLSVPVATNAVFGVVKSGSNITNNNGVLSVAKATASSLGVVKVGSNINVDNNGQISVPVANGSTKGVVSAGENVYNSDGVFSVNTATAGTKGVAQVGTNIDVNNGVISVKDASTSNKGVVQLTNDLADIHSTTLAATPNLVATVTDDLDGRKQDNMTATAPVDIDNSNVSLNFGDGLAVGVTGTTNANKLIVNEASVKEVLEDVVDGGTEPAVNEIVTADNLRSALSVGQAVDVSCPIGMSVNGAAYTTVQISGSTEWVALNSDEYKDNYLQDFSIKIGNINNTGIFWFGWSTGSWFPKGADNLVYLLLLDIRYVGSINLKSTGFGAAGNYIIPGVPYSVPESELTAYTSGMTRGFSRVACRFLGLSNNTPTSTGNIAYFTFKSNESGTAIFEVKNWRTYEVTNLTDEAIAYLAQLPDPDKLFRSQDFFDVSSGYMIKSDMVCPWTYLITMPTNSPAMTVASGLAYQLSLTDGAEHEITVDTFPTNAYGQDAHLQLLLANNSTAVFKSPLNLIDALTPNAAHNITVKFRAGQANVYVDDTDAGYVVSVNSGTESGSLYYGITGSTETYVVFAKNTDEQDIEMPELTQFTESKNIVGNGIDKTFVGGSIQETNASYGKKLNVSNLTVHGTITGSGAWHYVIVNNVLFDTSIATLYTTTGRSCVCGGGGHVEVTGCTFSDLTFAYDGLMSIINGNGYIKDTVITGCTAAFYYSGHGVISGSTFSGAAGIWSNGITVSNSVFERIPDSDGYFSVNMTVTFADTNKFIGRYFMGMSKSNAGAGLRFVNGSTLDLTELTNPNAIFAYHQNPATAAITGNTIGVITEAGSTTIGGTATVLYNAELDGETGVKSRTISGGGSNYIMRANGSIGVPVTTTTAGQAGSLDTLLADSTVEQITFAPVVDGSTINLTGVTSSTRFVINGDRSIVLTGTLVDGVSFTNRILDSVTLTNFTWRAAVADMTFANNRHYLKNVRITGYSSASQAASDNVKFNMEHCIVENNAIPIIVNNNSLSGNSVTDCVFRNNTGDWNIRVAGGDNYIARNVFDKGVWKSWGDYPVIFEDNTLQDVYVSAGTAYFQGVNVLGGTVSGAGTVVFADGATVTSTIPSGSTIGTGVISATPYTTASRSLGSNVLFENLTITGCTCTGPLFKSNSSTNATLRNCTISDNTIITGTGQEEQNFAVLTIGGILHLERVTISDNTGFNSNKVIAYIGGVIFVDGGCTFTELSIYQGNLVLSGDNTTTIKQLDTSSTPAKLVFTPGSITRTTQTSMTFGNSVTCYVGTYAEATGTVTTTGTATVVLNGTTVSISGSGTTIDSTGLHS